MKIRVLYLCSWRIGNFGKGAVDFVYDQIQFLSDEIEAVFVNVYYVSWIEWLKLKIANKDIQENNQLWPTEYVKSIDLYCPRISSRITKRSLLRDIELSGKYIGKTLERLISNIELIHVHVSLPMGIIGAELSKHFGVPFILQEHSGPFEMHTDTKEKEEYVKKVFCQSKLILPVGQDLSNRMSKYIIELEKIRVCSNLVRTDIFKPQPIPPKENIIKILIISHLQPVKGLEIFIEAMSLLRDMDYQIKASIVGTGEDKKLLKLISHYKLDDKISLFGRVEKKKLVDFYRDHHIYVCSSYTETFGLAPAEAIASGRPVVTTRCGGPDAFVNEKCGEIVEVGNPESLANGIIAVWNKLDSYKPYDMYNYIDLMFGPEIFKNNMRRIYKELTY